MNDSFRHSTRGAPRPRRAARAIGRVALLLGAPLVGFAATDVTDLSLEQLMQVTVVGASKYEQKQSDVAAAVSVITRLEIKAFGWRTLEEAIATLPGVYTTYDRQYTYFGARGFGLPGDENTRVLVMVNGNRLNYPTYDTGPLGNHFPVDMDLVERIEFIPGPGGAVYGQNAMFGVINVITRSGVDVNGTELAAGYQGTQDLSEGRLTFGHLYANGFDVLASYTRLSARGEDRFIDFGSSGISGVARGLDGEQTHDAFLNVARGAWSLEFMESNRVKGDPLGAYLSDPLVAGQYQGDRYTAGQLSYQDRFVGDALQVSGRLFGGRELYSSILSYGTPFSFPASAEWVGADLRLLSTSVARHKIMLGIEGQKNIRQDQDILDLANPVANIYIPGSGYRIGLYAQDEWRLSQAFAVTLGARVDRNDVTGTHLSPRLALIWQGGAGDTLKALYGRAFRAPNAFERDYSDQLAQVANPALGGESMDTLEIVYDHPVGRSLTLRASAYGWKVADLITLGIDPVSGLTQYQSGETDRARGLELSADKTWDGGARLRMNLAVQHVTRPGGLDLVNSPQVLSNLNLALPLHWAGLHAGYEMRYESRRLTLNGSWCGSTVLSALNLSTEALMKGLELSLKLRNLFDRHYSQPGADINWQNTLEQDGRSVRVQVRFAF